MWPLLANWLKSAKKVRIISQTSKLSGRLWFDSYGSLGLEPRFADAELSQQASGVCSGTLLDIPSSLAWLLACLPSRKLLRAWAPAPTAREGSFRESLRTQQRSAVPHPETTQPRCGQRHLHYSKPALENEHAMKDKRGLTIPSVLRGTLPSSLSFAFAA